MRGARDIWAVVPVKELRHAKTRLAPTLTPGMRAGLAHAMMQDVLCALAATGALAGIVVVTLDARAAALARRFGARVLEDGAREGHTAAVTVAGRQLAAEGREGLFAIAADIPCVTPAEVLRVLDAHGEAPAFTIVPSHDRRGSNAIAMSPPDAVPLAFGDDSFLSHLAASRHRGIEPTVVPLSGIGLDIDTPEDVAALLARPASSHARRYLAERA